MYINLSGGDVAKIIAALEMRRDKFRYLADGERNPTLAEVADQYGNLCHRIREKIDEAETQAKR